MTATFDDLTQPMTRAQVQESIYAALAAVGVNTTTWKPGAVTRTIIVVTSAVFASFTSVSAEVAKGGILGLAKGAWLKLHAKYTYDVEPLIAGFATGTLRLTNTGGGVYTCDPGELIVHSTTTGKSYRNTQTFTLNAGPGTVLDVEISAVEAGSASNALGGTINELTTSLLGVTCANLQPLVARDDETDPELTARCSERLGALSPFGPWDAYSYAVKTAKRLDGSSLGVTRVRLARDGFGNVTVYVADAVGGIVPGDVAIADEAVAQNAEPQGITATVLSAVTVTVNVTYEAWLYNAAGRTEAQIKAAQAVALDKFFRAQPIGGNVIPPASGKLFVSQLRAVIASAFNDTITVNVSLPAADVDIAANAVPVLGTIAATVHQVSTAEGFSV